MHIQYQTGSQENCLDIVSTYYNVSVRKESEPSALQEMHATTYIFHVLYILFYLLSEEIKHP